MAEIVDAWPNLGPELRGAVLAIVRMAGKGGEPVRDELPEDVRDYLETLTPPELTPYGYKRVFAIEENLRGMIERWPVEHLLVVSRTCKVPQPEIEGGNAQLPADRDTFVTLCRVGIT